MSRAFHRIRLIRCAEPVSSCDDRWEDAYRQFETPQQDVRKFLSRLKALGVVDWPLDGRVVELFCGRGNGLVALGQLGFTRIEGVDLSEALLSEYVGPATCYIADCRRLPFEDHSRDAVVVQGGLHHLTTLPGDLSEVLREANRVLVEGGRFVAVEPWQTPFLGLVHQAIRMQTVRRMWHRLDALATMIEREGTTYRQWLDSPRSILDEIDRFFAPKSCRCGWGKLMYMGIKRTDTAGA